MSETADITVSIRELQARYLQAAERGLEGLLPPDGVVRLEAEIVRRSVYQRAAYLVLAQQGATITAVCDPGLAQTLEEGTQGIVAGIPFIDRGSMSNGHEALRLRLISFETLGQGEGIQAATALRAQMEREGLFGEKRPLPSFDKTLWRIAVITGRESRAWQDIVSQWTGLPFFTPRKVEVSLQDPAEIARAILATEREPLDLVILARGGGNPEEIAVFNDIGIVRAMRSITRPIVAAIGHEEDRPLANDAADMVASTPSQAAERLRLLYTGQQTERITSELRQALQVEQSARRAAEQDAIKARAEMHDQITQMTSNLQKMSGAVADAQQRVATERQGRLRDRQEFNRLLAQRKEKPAETPERPIQGTPRWVRPTIIVLIALDLIFALAFLLHG